MGSSVAPIVTSDSGSSIWAYRGVIAAQSQPLIQYAYVTGSGASGAITVTIPTAYTSTTSYVAFASMSDAPAAQIYVTPLTNKTFTLGWSSGGAGSHTFAWLAVGS